jgi:hypothetical protein
MSKRKKLDPLVDFLLRYREQALQDNASRGMVDPVDPLQRLLDRMAEIQQYQDMLAEVDEGLRRPLPPVRQRPPATPLGPSSDPRHRYRPSREWQDMMDGLWISKRHSRL